MAKTALAGHRAPRPADRRRPRRVREARLRRRVDGGDRRPRARCRSRSSTSTSAARRGSTRSSSIARWTTWCAASSRRSRAGSPRERVEQAALAFLTYVKDQPDGFAVLSQDSPLTRRAAGCRACSTISPSASATSSPSSFKDAGYDPKAAPIYAHALVGMVTFVGKWWIEVRKPSRRGGGQAHRRARVDGAAPPAEAADAGIPRGAARQGNVTSRSGRFRFSYASSTGRKPHAANAPGARTS